MGFKITLDGNFTGRHMGLIFAEGTAHTEDSFLATRLRSKGYTVANHESVSGKAISDTGEASEEDFSQDTPETGSSEMYEKTVPQLKEYAAEKGINLGGARTKTEILAAINAAEADKEVQ